MNLILAKTFFANKKVKKEFLNRLKADNTIPSGLKNSFSISVFQEELITYIAVDKNEEVLGFVSAEVLDEAFIYDGDVALVSYYIFPEKRRKGYMTDAIKIFSRILFEEGINLLLFGISDSNNASREFAKSIGATQIERESWEYNISSD